MCDIRLRQLTALVIDTHFCEGSFMGNSTFSLVMTLAPSRVPLLLRPIAKSITSTLAAQVSEPALKESLGMVSALSADYTIYSSCIPLLTSWSLQIDRKTPKQVL